MKPLSQERIRQIIEKWYMLEPLYFALWTTHELHINSSISNLRSGAGRIDYNPDFIASLDETMLEQVLRFEAMRLLLKHPYQRRQPQAEFSYQASNITVQEYLNTPLPIANAAQTFNRKQVSHLHFEQYYQLLIEKSDTDSVGNGVSNDDQNGEEGESSDDGSSMSKQSEEKNSHSSDDSNENKSSKTKTAIQNVLSIDDTPLEHYSWATTAIENTETWDLNEYQQHKINEKIAFAQQNNQWGSIAGKLQQSLLASLKPKLNYRAMLKHFRASILSTHRCLTRMKPSRRYGFHYMGSRRDFNTHLLVAVDVSGSISNDDVQCAFSVINQLFKYGMEVIDVIQFDTEIKGKVLQLTKARYQINIKGRGGTDFQAPLDYIDAHRYYDGLIIFTDGYAPEPTLPKNRKTTLFWLFNHQQNYQATQKNLNHLGYSGFILA
jgi:predicted metal-dependent peptidase